ncbi:MAG TPA: hypothetical protein VNO21_16945 [Polyangiaceae bacterium]|nr:hypothetical protein [Polyangiaceae bacterium]
MADSAKTVTLPTGQTHTLVVTRRIKVKKIMGFAPVTVRADGSPASVVPGFHQLASSVSTSTDLNANPPVVLLLGTTNILLEAETDPPNKPVTWSVVAAESTTTPPPIDPIETGCKAVLKTTTQGAFSVQATGTDGAPPIVWNVVFVAVQVRQVGAIQIAPGSGYSGYFLPLSNGGLIQVVTGNTPAPAWAATLAVRLIGAGSRSIGVDSIELKMLSNGVDTSVTASYANDAFTIMKQSRERVSRFPVVDTDDQTGDPLIHFPLSSNKNAVTISPEGGELFVRFLDSPRTKLFRVLHPSSADAKIRTFDGSMKFRTALAAISKRAPHSVVVYAYIAWEADVSGSVETKNIPMGGANPLPGAPLPEATWTATSTTGTRCDPRFVILPAGADAQSMGFEIWPPNYLQQVERIDDP